MAKLKGVKHLRSDQREIKKLLLIIRFKSISRKQGEGLRAARRLWTTAGDLIRIMQRKLSPEALEVHQQSQDLSGRVPRQQRSDSHKTNNLIELEVFCLTKGKTRNKYEFDAKDSMTVTKTSGIIFAALSIHDNPFDSHTLPAVLPQVESFFGKRPTIAMCNRGYRGKRKIGMTRIEFPNQAKGQKLNMRSAKPRSVLVDAPSNQSSVISRTITGYFETTSKAGTAIP